MLCRTAIRICGWGRIQKAGLDMLRKTDSLEEHGQSRRLSEQAGLTVEQQQPEHMAAQDESEQEQSMLN